MDLHWWDAFAVLIAGAVLVTLWRRPSPEKLRAVGERFARERLAYVDAEFVPSFDVVTVKNRRLGAVLCAALVLVTWFVLRHGIDWEPAFDVLVLTYAVALSAVAPMNLWLAGREFPARRDRAVVARVRHVRLVDYVPPFVLWAFAAMVGLQLGVGLVALREFTFFAVAVLVVATCGGLGLACAWLICRRPESSVDRAHLYLQDAWRAVAILRVLAPVGFGTAALAVNTHTLDVIGWWATPTVLVIGAAGNFALPVVQLRYRLWFRNRLWPELAPGQIIRPGEQVAA